MTQSDDKPDEAGEWFPLVVFAARLAGEEGWIVDEAPMTLDEIEAAIRTNGHPLVEIRKISQGASRLRNADGSPRTDGPMAWLVRSRGWAYDEVADCWRAPGEMPSEPAGVPGRIAHFAVASEAPDAGWWPLVVKADAISVRIAASNVYDPVRDLLQWLDDLVAGRAARLLIDEEGEQTEIRAYPKEQGLVRLVVFDYGDEADEQVIDGVVGLREVVGEFYAAFAELTRDAERYRQDWLYHLLDEDEEAPPPPVASPAIVAFVSRHREP
jgi:hypothetical protein